VSQGTVPTQAELLKLWDINEEAAAPPATTVKLPIAKPAVVMTDAINAMANSVRDAMIAAIDMATGTPITVKTKQTARRAKSPEEAKPAKRATPRATGRPATSRAVPKKAALKKAAAARRS
jgi:hypothetical protein